MNNLEIEEWAISLLTESYSGKSKARERKIVAIVESTSGQYFTGYRGEVVKRVGDKNVSLHAERIALDKAGDQAKGSTLYTTLEPCINTKEKQITDSCSKLIIERGVAKVVMGIFDENPQIETRGWQFLRQNGVPVEFFSNENRAILEQKTQGDDYYRFSGKNGTRWRFVRDETQLGLVFDFKRDMPLKVKWSLSSPVQMQLIHGSNDMVSHAFDGSTFEDNLVPSMISYRSNFCRLVSGQFAAVKLSDDECFLFLLREKDGNNIEFRWRYVND